MNPLNQPGKKFLDRQNQVDIRLKRGFTIGKFSFEAQADAYNAFNTGVVLTRVQTWQTWIGRRRFSRAACFALACRRGSR